MFSTVGEKPVIASTLLFSQKLVYESCDVMKRSDTPSNLHIVFVLLAREKLHESALNVASHHSYGQECRQSKLPQTFQWMV